MRFNKRYITVRRDFTFYDVTPCSYNDSHITNILITNFVIFTNLIWVSLVTLLNNCLMFNDQLKTVSSSPAMFVRLVRN